jgi:glycosyltransferase involved in cell wall biosynthesis
MYKVADYLIQAQAPHAPQHAAQMRPLDTRGPGSAAASLGMLMRALGKLVRGRVDGTLAGVHVNMAERLSLFRKGSIVVACRALGIPVVIHLHAQMRGFYRSLPAPLRALTRWMFRQASGVIVIGEGPRRFVTEELGVPGSRIDVVINGTPGPAAPPERQADSQVRHVVFVGRLCEPKGVSDLLQGFARARIDRARVKLVLAGNGDIERYTRLARELGVEAGVEFAGWCDQARVHELLRQADLLVLPSHDEVLPLVVLEALAHAVPVVCTPVGELPAVLTNGETACFAPVGDVDQLARAIEQVLADAQLRDALGRNGRALYEAKFSLQRFFANVARIHRRHFGLAAVMAEPASEETVQ